jgi:6-phosphogluconate dehydrogenase
VALDLAVAIPTIGAALDGRVLSSLKDQRVAAGRVFQATDTRAPFAPGDRARWQDDLRDALYAARICSYAQGMALIAAGSHANKWGTDLKEMARIWKGGCIIRARFLDTIMKAYDRDRALPNLFLDEQIRRDLEAALPNYRRIVALAFQRGIPVPAMSAGLAYYDAYRSKSLPQNLTQAQRDAFGAHTYQRNDDATGVSVHTEWLA